MVTTFHLHCLGHRIKYGNTEVGNITQQFNNFCKQNIYAAVLSLLNHFYFESLSSHIIQAYIYISIYIYIWYILYIYYIYLYIYICIYIYKVSYIHSFFVTFGFNVFSALHNFQIGKNILWNWWVDSFIAGSIKWCDTFGCSYWIQSLFYGVFSSPETCVSFGVLDSCLSLSQSA